MRLQVEKKIKDFTSAKKRKAGDIIRAMATMREIMDAADGEHWLWNIPVSSLWQFRTERRRAS